jgi:arylsulfatase A-like enzyme
LACSHPSQIGKNHLGDRNEFLPTVHGFDEFYGNLYHLNAEEEPEDPDYPKGPDFKSKFGPRGVLDVTASDKDDEYEDPRFGKVGKQIIKDTGPLTRERMDTVEEDLLARSLGFIDRSNKAGKPFFLWHNATRMHVWTRLDPKWENKSGYGLYADGMMELDHVVGELLKKLDDLGITDNTIVVFTSDNGPEKFTWPDGGSSPFKDEKGQTFEGGFRVPGIARWPGVIKPGSIINEIMSHEDWLPTFLAAAGDPNINEELKKGFKVGDKTFKTYIDGFNFMPFFKGEVAKGPRQSIFYFDDTAKMNAVRVGDWKIHFAFSDHWYGGGPAKPQNFPQVVNLREDPFEAHVDDDNSPMYFRWAADKLWTIVPAQQVVGQWLATFKEFPPSQESASFSLDQVLRQLQTPASAGGN